MERSEHTRLLAEVQRLRGRIYLNDGAIRARDLSTDGRHQQAADEKSWHVLTLRTDGSVSGCARFRPFRGDVRFKDLSVFRSAMAKSASWGPRLRRAIRDDIQRARRRSVAYAEVGGWALAEDVRQTTAALKIVLETFALAAQLGGCLGVTTATHRHSSSSILRRLGGEPLRVNQEELPAYFDPQYGCVMEILSFDSTRLSEKYRHLLPEVVAEVPAVAVAPADAA